MFDAGYFFMGVIFGFCIAAMPGPIGIICIQRTLDNGKITGLVSGLGTATADAIYCSIAGFGVTYISALLIEGRVWLQMIGGLFLVFLGLKTFFSRPYQRSEKKDGSGLLAAYTSMFLLTLSNPLTILLFAGVTAGVGVGMQGKDYFSVISLVIGVFIGSILWWAIMSFGVSLIQSRVKNLKIYWINRFIGAIICIIGVFSLIDLFII